MGAAGQRRGPQLGNLYRNQRKRVPRGASRIRHQVIAMEETNDGTAFETLDDGHRLEFDLLVCADGYRSLGRRRLFAGQGVEYAGYVLW